VETDSQLEQVRALGCDGAQGFLFSAAIPGAGVDELLARH
jgi:EAL domain-containing protein (putative c-di-GMP-specific phosphodiesterase class I)